jgi:hypothetical protein
MMQGVLLLKQSLFNLQVPLQVVVETSNSSGGGVAVIPIPVDNFTEILAMIG